MTTEARLREELAEVRAELHRLRQQPVVAVPTVHKDLSLISIVPKWSGSESAVPLEEFLSHIESAAKIGRWEDEDKVRIAIVRLTEPARTFYNTNRELHSESVTWQRFKEIFAERFKDVKTDQFHFNRLQSARQLKNESPQDFADRCRALSQRVMYKTNDPVAQGIHRANAERMCLASFTAGLIGPAGQHVRISNPQDMQHALSLALSATEALKQEKASEIFFTSADQAHRYNSRTSRRKGREYKGPNQTADSEDRRDGRSKIAARDTRPARNQECYECGGFGHFSKECPTRLKREGFNRKHPGGRDTSGRPRRPTSPREEPSREYNQGNE
jgi:hypothetical protein